MLRLSLDLNGDLSSKVRPFDGLHCCFIAGIRGLELVRLCGLRSYVLIV